jgi:dipeptidyl aminopeptidase/acylaminoacyl peptidase
MILALLTLLVAAGPSAATDATSKAKEGASAESTIPGMAPAPGNPRVLVSGVPPVPQGLKERLLQYQNARGAALLDVDAQGRKVLISTRFGRTAQLHVVETPLGMRRQLTFYEEPIASARFQPGNPDVLWFTQDAGGGEFFQVYRFDLRTGRAQRITDGKARHEALLVAHDGRRLAWSGTGRNGRDADVYVADALRPTEARALFEAEGTFYPLDFSPGGKQLLVEQFRSASDSDLLIVNVETGERRRLTPADEKGSVRAAAFAADGRSVWLVTDRWSDFDALYRLDLARAGSKPEPYTAALRWDVEAIEVAQDGTRVAVVVNEDGLSALNLLEPRTRRVERVKLPPGVVTSLAFPRQRSSSLFVAVNGPKSPNDVLRVDVRSKAVERWTRSEVGGLDLATFTEPELVRYPSTGDVRVPAFLYRPPAERFPGKRPVVITWHGGPEGQSRPLFLPFAQFLVNELGYAVLEPNVRGSTGYGKRYLAMDDGVRREAALADIGATLDFVSGTEGLDADRIAVYGGSYGGYMTLASLMLHPDRIRAGVSVVGISSLPSFLENTQAYRRDLRRAEYGDERVPEVRAVQERISPLQQVDRIRPRALFVLQGKNDPRVPQSESEQIVKAVREKGRDVWYLLALDEGHGFAKKENRDLVSASVAQFLSKALGDGATAGAQQPKAATSR